MRICGERVKPCACGLLLALLVSCTATHADERAPGGAAATKPVAPHPVPSAFASAERFSVTVNGVKVPVFHAGVGVFFAGYDLGGPADVSVTASEVNRSL